MKFTAVILSIYIMALTTMPCTDNHTSDEISSTFELSELDHIHSSDIDLCSPFCFCNCCQTLSQLTIYKSFQIYRIGFNLSIPVSVQNEIEYIISFWQPPKV